jgi:hypothetical protein
MFTIRKPSVRRRRFATLTGGLVVAAAVSMFGGPAAIADLSPPTEFLDLDAKPVFDWSVPDRYAQSWGAWNSSNATYDPDFVNPDRWSINLNGCASTSLYHINRYTFTIAQLGTTWAHTLDLAACNLQLHHVLPAQGLYRVTLTLHTDMGVNSGVSLPTSRSVGVKDYLVVSIGDSLASGEGNPDQPGSYDVNYNVLGEATSATTIRSAWWRDTRCHRSARSGPALAAQAYEDADSHTSVTFLSVACSGAEIRHLISTRYQGIAPEGNATVPPQVDAIHDLVGPSGPRGGRTIDALLVSAGVNDLGFSDIIQRCATNPNVFEHQRCVTDGGIANTMALLPARYDALAAALREKLPATREVYLNNYPANVFRGGACGVLGLPGVGIDDVEAAEINRWGVALDARIAEATDRFRTNANRWNLVDDLSGPFSAHAYCDNPSWFRSYSQSWEGQGDENGTAHPNAAGHLAYRDVIRRAMVPTQVGSPYRHLTVTIKAVRAAAVSGSPTLPVRTALFEYQNDAYPLTRVLNVPQNGLWTNIPATLGTFVLDVYPAPSTPRHAVALHMILNSNLSIVHTLHDGYGVGTHAITDPTGRLVVSYNVVAE